MRTNLFRKRCCYPVLISILLAGLGAAARSEDLPSYMEPIAGRTSSTAASVANANVLALNASMFQLYAKAGAVFRQNLMAKHPIILGLFSGAGGRFILYRPGMAPLEAPSVPIAYQLLKSVGHSTMALAEIVMPYLDNASDTSWRASLSAYRSEMQSAVDGLSATDMPKEWQENSRIILQNNIAFMDDSASKGVISVAALREFAKKQAPVLKKEIAWAAQTQVAHWMGVLADWKKQLGEAWDSTYAASNTIYVARQNNVLFSVLAQFFGADAINNRLMLIETMTFTTTPEEMFEIADQDHCRSLGRRGLLRRLPLDGLRVDGWRRPSGHHRRHRQARYDGVPASRRAVRLPPVADPDHARQRSEVSRRTSSGQMISRERRFPRFPWLRQ